MYLPVKQFLTRRLELTRALATVPSPAQLADQLAAALVRGDADALDELYAPDLRFVVHAEGTERDRDQAIATFRSLRPGLRDFTLEILDRHVHDHGFVTQQRLRCTAPDGAPVEVDVCLVARVRNGRITRIDEYFDSRAVAPLLARLPAAA